RDPALLQIASRAHGVSQISSAKSHSIKSPCSVRAAAHYTCIERLQGHELLIEEYTEYVPPGVRRDAIRQLYAGKTTMTGGPHSEPLMYALGAEFVEVRIQASTRESAFRAWSARSRAATS